MGLNKNLNGMKISGAWSGASMISGGIGYFSSDSDRWRAYHGTNFVFGALNALVVYKGQKDLRVGKTAQWSYEESKRQHKKIERLYLFNNGFNYAFIFGGLFLTEKSKSFSSIEKKQVYQGIGEGLITQGIFFLIFDTSMYFVQKDFNDNSLNKMLPDEISVMGNQIGFRWNLN